MKATGCPHASGSGAKIALVVKMLLLLAVLPLTPLLKAQSFYGSVVGTVTDSSGAIVPGATVTITNLGTSEATKVITDSAGKYSAVNLVPADYSVAVEKTNFKRYVREHVPVQVGATIRIDAALAVGEVSQTVQVTTAVPLLQTDSSTLGQEVEGAQVQQMPLNGRNVENLIALAPGVVPTGGSLGGTGLNQGTRTAGGAGWGNYEIGGSIQGQSAQYLDGVANNLLGGNVVALVPTQDAIQEFNVASSNAGADFGRYSGGVVNLTTRSGSNSFHGGVWEYLRNKDFNANDWFSNGGDGTPYTPRGVWNQNQYGATLSGPIVKNKVFFMFTWEAFKALTASLSTTNVPTVALQNGVFNNTSAGLGKSTTLPVDPLGNCTFAPYTGQSVNGQTFAAGGYYITNLYTGACGDVSNETMKQFFPVPNATGSSNYILKTPLGNNQEQYTGRVDYVLSDKQRLFGRYTYWAPIDQPHTEFNDTGYKNGTSGNGTTWPTDDGQAAYKTTQAVLGDTYTINPSTVADLRVEYVRQYSPNLAQGQNVTYGQFGTAYAALTSQMNVHLQPAFNTTNNGGGAYNLYNMGNYPNDGITWYNTYGISPNLTKIVGAHSFKFGAELRLMDTSSVSYNGGGSGSFQYGNNGFMNDEWANFLLGYAETEGNNAAVTFKTDAKVAAYTYYSGYYVQDTWQATHNLTLNLGLRYELPGSPAERNNKAVVLLPNATDPVSGVKGTESLVASSLYGSRTVVQEKYDLFAPRVGFAYRFGENTVIRGGYGISYLPDDISGAYNAGNAIINGATTTVNIPNNGNPVPLQTALGCIGTGPSGAGCGALGLAQAGLVTPGGRGNGQPTYFMHSLVSSTSFLNQKLQAPVPYQNYPYDQQWNIAASHQFKGDFMAEVGYAGMKGTNLPGSGNRNLNELADGSYSSTGIYTGSGPGNGLALNSKTLANGSAFQCTNTPGFAAGAITVGQCNMPFPYYGQVNDTAEYYARGNYRSFLVRAEKRMGAAGVINANYTWSQNYSNTDTQTNYIEAKATTQGGSGAGSNQDWNNLNGDYSLISYDVTNRFIANYVLNMPFGKGQKYGNSFGDAANAIVSGWAVNGITTFQSGFPVFFSDGGQSSLGSYGAGTIRPNKVAGCNPVIGGSGLARAEAGAWFNTSCFANPSAYQFGDEPRVDPQVRADGVKDFDFAIQKSTPIWESSSFEFRAEFFNIFNRVQFAPPVSSVGGGNYGNVTYQVNKPRQMQLSARINF